MKIQSTCVVLFTIALSGVSAFVPANVAKPTTAFVATAAKSSPVALNFFGSLLSEAKPESATDTVSEGKIRSLFYLWNDALATGDSRLVAKRYASDAILLPTVSDEPRTDFKGIKDYFDNFLKLKPQVCSMRWLFVNRVCHKSHFGVP